MNQIEKYNIWSEITRSAGKLEVIKSALDSMDNNEDCSDPTVFRGLTDIITEMIDSLKNAREIFYNAK